MSGRKVCKVVREVARKMEGDKGSPGIEGPAEVRGHRLAAALNACPGPSNLRCVKNYLLSE